MFIIYLTQTYKNSQNYSRCQFKQLQEYFQNYQNKQQIHYYQVKHQSKQIQQMNQVINILAELTTKIQRKSANTFQDFITKIKKQPSNSLEVSFQAPKVTKKKPLPQKELQLDLNNPQDRALQLVLRMNKMRRIKQQQVQQQLKKYRKTIQVETTSKVTPNYHTYKHNNESFFLTNSKQKQAVPKKGKQKLKKQLEVLQKSMKANEKYHIRKFLKTFIIELCDQAAEKVQKKKAFYFHREPRYVNKAIIPTQESRIAYQSINTTESVILKKKYQEQANYSYYTQSIKHKTLTPLKRPEQIKKDTKLQLPEFHSIKQKKSSHKLSYSKPKILNNSFRSRIIKEQKQRKLLPFLELQHMKDMNTKKKRYNLKQLQKREDYLTFSKISEQEVKDEAKEEVKEEDYNIIVNMVDYLGNATQYKLEEKEDEVDYNYGVIVNMVDNLGNMLQSKPYEELPKQESMEQNYNIVVNMVDRLAQLEKVKALKDQQLSYYMGYLLPVTLDNDEEDIHETSIGNIQQKMNTDTKVKQGQKNLMDFISASIIEQSEEKSQTENEKQQSIQEQNKSFNNDDQKQSQSEKYQKVY